MHDKKLVIVCSRGKTSVDVAEYLTEMCIRDRAISIHERKMVYALTFAIWFIPILFKNSSMHIFQPFIEYDFNVAVPVAIWLSLIHI